MADGAPRRGFETPAEVTDFFDQKVLRPGFSWQDVWGQEHAYAFTVAKAVELELLTTFKTSISTALATGQTFETWRAGLMPQLGAIGWDMPRPVADPTGQQPPRDVDFAGPRRLRTIFQANMASARSAGQWNRAQRTKAAFPYVLYVRTASAEPRLEHLTWVGIILPIDDAWWSTHWPPNGWGCKCSIRQITARERAKLLAMTPEPGGISYTDAVPDNGPPRTFTNSRTGEVTSVPAGIDPGWGGNPGLDRAQTLLTRVTQQLEAAGEADARRAIAAIATSDMPRVMMALPEAVFMPVAVAPPALVEALGAEAKIVQVSNATMRTKVAKHVGDRAVTAATFALVQKAIDKGRIVDEGRDRHRSIFSRIAGGLWQAVVKSASGGRQLILATFHAAKPRDQARAERKAAKVKG